MTNLLCTRTLALTLIAPAAALLPPRTQPLAPAEAVALHARFDPSLGSLRAGRVAAPAPFGASERAELVVAEQNSTSLDALRGGAEPTDNEWTWLAIGAGLILLIILI